VFEILQSGLCFRSGDCRTHFAHIDDSIADSIAEATRKSKTNMLGALQMPLLK